MVSNKLFNLILFIRTVSIFYSSRSTVCRIKIRVDRRGRRGRGGRGGGFGAQGSHQLDVPATLTGTFNALTERRHGRDKQQQQQRETQQQQQP